MKLNEHCVFFLPAMKKKIKDFEEKFEEENGYKVCGNVIFFSKIRNNSFLLIWKW
jgi:diaminopimelate epimerase